MSRVHRAYGERLVHLQRRIARNLGQVPLVFYNAYGVDEGGLPIDNLDEIAIEGRVRFCIRQNSPSQRFEHFCSEVIDSPTWMDVAVVANGMLRLNTDRQRRFLTGVRVPEERGGLRTVEIRMESWANAVPRRAVGLPPCGTRSESDVVPRIVQTAAS